MREDLGDVLEGRNGGDDPHANAIHGGENLEHKEISWERRLEVLHKLLKMRHLLTKRQTIRLEGWSNERGRRRENEESFTQAKLLFIFSQKTASPRKREACETFP